MASSSIYIHAPKISLLGLISEKYLWISRFKKKFVQDIISRFPKIDPAPIPNKYTKEFDISQIEIANRTVYQWIPKYNRAEQLILFFHGGGYVNNIVTEHWDFIAEIVRKTGAKMVVPDYPLAPEYCYKDAFDMLQEVYTSLLSEWPNTQLTIMGDSAGGGLSLAFVQKLAQDDLMLPRQIILLSPWLDVTMSHPQIATIEPKDPMLEKNALIEAGKLWARETETSHFLISPLNGNLESLPPISIFTGGKDILYPDAIKLKNSLSAKGTSVNYYEYPAMFHDWFVVTFLSEAQCAIEQMSRLILQKT